MSASPRPLLPFTDADSVSVGPAPAGRVDPEPEHAPPAARRSSSPEPPPQAGPPASATGSQRTRALLLAILALAILLRIAAFRGYTGSDDGSYAELANALATGTFRVGEYTGPPVFPLRVGTFAPVALGFRLFGPGEAAMLAYPFAVSLAAVLLAFFAARALFGTAAGLLAAGLQAILPLATESASILMPDLFAAFWGNVAVLLLYFGGRRMDARRGALWGAAAGAALGAAWLSKESAVYLAPILALLVIGRLRQNRRHAGLAAAFVGVAGGILALESLVYLHHTGDFFHRLHETQRTFSYSAKWHFAEGSRFGWEPGEYHLALKRRFLSDGPRTIFASLNFGGVPFVAGLAVLYGLLARRRAFLFPGLWFVSLVLMFNFGSTSVGRWLPLVLMDKYLFPILFPAILLTAGFLVELGGAARARRPGTVPPGVRRGAALCLAAALLLLCAAGNARKVRTRWKNGPERALARVVGPQDLLYTDKRTLRILRFFWGFPKESRAQDFQGLTTAAIPPGAYVLVNPEKLAFLRSNYDYSIPDFCSAPADRLPRSAGAGWRLVRQIGAARLYRVEPAAGKMGDR